MSEIRVPGPWSLQPAGEDRQANGRHSGITVPEILFLLREEPRFGLTWLSAAVLAVCLSGPRRFSSRKGLTSEHYRYFSPPPDRSFHAAGDSDFHLTHSAFRLPDHSSLHPTSSYTHVAPGPWLLLPPPRQPLHLHSLIGKSGNEKSTNLRAVGRIKE